MDTRDEQIMKAKGCTIESIAFKTYTSVKKLSSKGVEKTVDSIGWSRGERLVAPLQMSFVSWCVACFAAMPVESNAAQLSPAQGVFNLCLEPSVFVHGGYSLSTVSCA